MNAHTRFWIQIGGAALMAGLALAQGTRLMERTYDSLLWIMVLALAAVYMLFEAWRTRRRGDAPAKVETREVKAPAKPGKATKTRKKKRKK